MLEPLCPLAAHGKRSTKPSRSSGWVYRQLTDNDIATEGVPRPTAGRVDRGEPGVFLERRAVQRERDPASMLGTCRRGASGI